MGGKYCSLLMLLGVLSAPAAAVTIAPETPTEVEVSNRDLNRLVCPVSIGGIYASDERGLISKIDGKNAFFKFNVYQDGEQVKYAQEETTIFATCGGESYTLRLKPKDISAQTLYLANPTHKNKANVALYAGMALEERVTDLTLRAIKDDFPDSFTVKTYPPKKRHWLPEIADGVKLMKIREITPEGLGLQLTEFMVQAQQRISLHESQFVNPRLAKNIIGVTLGDLKLFKGQKSQLYVVTLNKES